ncbi:MAG TPA: hypothetical protein VHQ95_04560 [Pyrinomonadaceae bacterium]|nr:hypothetical protein [Pyrinomonadaceae bacterium]
MNRPKEIRFRFVSVLTLGLMLFANGHSSVHGQKLAKPINIQAQAMGTSTQLGRNFGVTVIINEFSPPSDQKILLEAFQQKGNEGLVNALSKMPSKGRVAITGTLGGDIAYARKFSLPDGSTKIRVVTNRLLRFGEVWADTRSSDYQLSALEIILSPHKGKSTGTLLPASELKVNKENQLEIELFQNPWNLVNVQRR